MPSIPTAHPGGSVAKSRLEGPPRKPQPGVNIHPDSRLAQPQQPKAPEGPHPFLQAHGFNGNIQSFNRRAALAKQGFENTYKQPAPPGVVWDVARKENILDGQIPALFRIPLDTRQLKPEQAHHEATWDGSGIHQREDGKLQPTNLLTAFHDTLRSPYGNQELPSGPTVLKMKEFQKRYPTIPVGYSDFLPAGKKFWEDVYQSNVNVKPIVEHLGNLTAADANKMAAQSGGQGFQALQAAEMQGSLAIPAQQEQQQFAQSSKAGLQRDVTSSYSAAVDRNVTRQKWLQSHDPAGLFSGLPTNGRFDKAWMTAFSKWSRTPSAAYNMLQFQAKQNEFDPTPAGVRQMLQAVKFKQEYVNSKKGLTDKWMAQAMPLQFFSHHMYAASLYSAVGNLAKPNGDLTKQFEQATKDWWNYTTKGVPAWQYMLGVGELQSGFREAKLLYNTLGGAWNQATAYGTAATTLLGQLPKVFDGMSTKQLADHVAQSLADNPDMVRLLGFGYLPENLKGKAAFWDQFGNFIVNTALSLAIKGPGYFKFDETTPLAEIRAHPVVNLMTRLAHNNIKVGDLWEAEKIFGTQASETFLAATAKGVQDGSISAGDFHNLATEFYKHGRVELPDGSVVDKGTVMPQLRDQHMPKHVTTLKLRDAVQSASRAANQIEKVALSHGGSFGSAAESFIRSLRGTMELASPEGETVPIYHLQAGQLESFILNSGIMSREEATQAVSKFIIARGRENTVQIEKVLKGVIDRFNEKYPLKAGFAPPPFEGLVDTEGRVNIHFPTKQGRRFTNEILGGMEKATQGINEVGRYWRQSILGEGALSLFEKHSTRDTAAALLGGTPLREGERSLSLPSESRLAGNPNERHIPIQYRSANDITVGAPGGSHADMPKGGGVQGYAVVENGKVVRVNFTAPPGKDLKYLGKFIDQYDRNPKVQAAAKAAVESKFTLGVAERLDRLVKSDPEVARYLGYSRKDVTSADTVYSQSFKSREGEPSYNLMEKVHEKPNAKNELAVGASEYLRRQVSSDIYPFYLDFKRTGDLSKITDEVLRNPKLLSKMRATTNVESVVAALKKEYEHPGQLTLEGKTGLREAIRRARAKAAAEYAQAVAKRFDAIQQAGKDAGIGDLMGEALQTIHAAPGATDKKLADYLLQHEVNLAVPTAEPQAIPKFEKVMGKAIRWGMTPNRFWRTKMFDGLTHRYFDSFLKDGYDEKQAALSAIEAAKTQTMFHLLDFSNMLEFERKFRGFLPFFTKHRLFVKWLFTTFAQHPYLAVPLQQISKKLDPYGRLNFHLPFVGPVNINFMRLLFLSSETLPYSFPGAQFIPGLKGVGVASEFTRWDTTFALLYNWGAGKGYGTISKHLDPYDQSRLNRYMAIYAMKWRMEHGLGAPVSEKAALDYAVTRMAPMMAWNNSISAPTFSRPDLPPRLQKLNDQFDKLVATNPKAATAFIDKHPEVGMAWGVSQNWHVYNHTARLWGLYDGYIKDYLKVENKYGAMVEAGKTLTPDDYRAMHQASKLFGDRIEYLKKLDAITWNSETQNKGELGFPAASYDPSSNVITQPGPWYTQYSHNMLGAADNLITLFGRKTFSAKDLHAIYGYDITTWEAELQDPNLDGSVKAQIIQRLKAAQGAQKVTSTPTFYSAYQKARSSYENKVYGLYKKASKASGVQKSILEYQARELIAKNVTNPTITFDGKTVKVLPFGDYSLVAKTPSELSGQIWGSDSTHKGMVGYSYSTLTIDQKKFLGINTTPQVDKAWGIYNYWKAAYEAQTGKTISTTVEHDYAIALNREYPGFWKDYQIAHLPKSYVLLEYAKGSFTGPYASYWKELVTKSYETWRANKSSYYSTTVPWFDHYMRQNWPKGFVQQYEAAGGQAFLRTLNYAWG